MKFWEIFRFEIYYQLRRPSTWIYFVFILALISLVINEIADYARNVEAVLLNSPMTVAEISGYANKFGLLLVAALAADGAMRDIQARMDPLLYTTSLHKIAYLGGRFFGTFFLAGMLLIPTVPLSLLLASVTPGVDAAFFGPFQPFAYINASLFLTLPNIFIATAILFALVLLTRRVKAAYVGGGIIFVLSTFSLEIAAGNWDLAKLVDPSGITVIDAFSRSLTPLQLPTQLVEFNGFLLANRALWLIASLLVTVKAYTHFQFSYDIPGIERKQSAAVQTDAPVVSERTSPVKSIEFKQLFNTATRLYQTHVLAWRYFRGIVTSPVVLAIPAIALYAFVLIPNLAQGALSVPGLPTTHRITSILNNAALEAMVVMLIALLTGQAVWRERDARLHEIYDAAPVPTETMLLSKFLGIAFVLILLQAALLLAGIAIQLVAGYHLLEIGLYLQMLFGVELLGYLLISAVAMAIHVLVNQKYVGHLVVVLFYLYTILPRLFGLEHKLLIFGSDVGLASSVFYSHGPFMFPWLLYKLYWIGWALVLMVVARHMWVRGRETFFRRRLKQAFSGLKSSPVLAGAFLLIVSTGALIFYSTNILNEYLTAEVRIWQQVAYERLYGKYKKKLQPHLTGTKLHIEFYPDKRKALVKGVYQLQNSTGEPVDTLHIAIASEVETSGIRFSRKATAVITDEKLGHYIYLLGTPLQPNDSLLMQFEVRFDPKGFSNNGVNTAVINNGSYFSSQSWLPAMGYQASRELSGDRMRAENGLPKIKKLPSPQDQEALMDIRGQNRISFEATLGTAGDQIAVAPGALRRTWNKDGRRYFHYKADSPIRNMYHIYSAAYEVRESHWRDIAIQLFHHPQHVLNLETMESAMKASLDYYTRHFSPYPFRQLKLVEYPDPGTGGISLPGTIGYSTNFALLHTGNDKRGFDLPFAVVAHEVAHQWWAHQLIPAQVKGAALLTESLAWYSALGVVEQVHGPVHLRNLLDAMRLAYLNPRSRAGMSLLLADDAFQAYRKGPLAMYALREYVGEEKVNLALQNLLRKFKSGAPPFATSLDFYAEVQEVTPDSLQYLLHDLFGTNTFWELKTEAANIKPADAGNWTLTMDVHARKVQVDTAGLEIEVPMDDLIEVGVFGRGNGDGTNPIYLKKQKIHSGVNRIVIKVSEKPEEAGIDPRHLLIDTEVYDNVRQVTNKL